MTTQIDLTSGEQVQGTLPVANGGTGSTSLSGAGIEQTTNKNAANGYAGLNSSGYVPPGELGSGTANSTTFLRGDSTYAAPTAGPPPLTTQTTTQTLTTAYNTWVFTGTTATWTLPTVASTPVGFTYTLESRGSGTLTVIPTSGDHIWIKSAVTTYAIASEGSVVLVNDGTYWDVISIDLTNRSIGTLAVANGGTGVTTLTAGLVTASGTSNFSTVAAPAGTVVGTTDSQTLTNKTLTSPVLGGTATGTYTLGGTPSITDPTITGYVEATQALGTVTTSKTIPAPSAGTLYSMTLTNADTCVITMPTAVTGMSFAVLIMQPSTTGSGLVTWAGGTAPLWPANGTAPAMSQGANAADLYTFFAFGFGGWLGSYVQGYVI